MFNIRDQSDFNRVICDKIEPSVVRIGIGWMKKKKQKYECELLLRSWFAEWSDGPQWKIPVLQNSLARQKCNRVFVKSVETKTDNTKTFICCCFLLGQKSYQRLLYKKNFAWMQIFTKKKEKNQRKYNNLAHFNSLLWDSKCADLTFSRWSSLNIYIWNRVNLF